jgi:ATP phosphoribosyltransferase
MNLRLALPLESLDESLTLLAAAGLGAPAGAPTPPPRLVDGTIVAAVPSADVAVLVAAGGADVGFAARDLLDESGADLCRLLDLGIGGGRLVFATLNGGRRAARRGRLRVATCHPRAARAFAARRGLQVEVVALSRRPTADVAARLADAVLLRVDEDESEPPPLGEAVEVARCSQVLICTRASWALQRAEIGRLAQRLRAVRVGTA